MLSPLVTVCVPTYNGASHLQACLDSVRAQTYGEIEILVVDDCSTDGTSELAERYAQEDKRCRVVRNNTNLGLVANWENCVRLAQGEYIKFVFQDDILYPTCTELLVRAIQSGVRFAFCAREFISEIDGNNALLDELRRGPRRISALFAGEEPITPEVFCAAVLDAMPLNIVGEPIVTLMHRNILREYGPFNADFLQLMDFEYWCRIGANENIAHVPEVLAKFRIHSKSETSRNLGARSYQVRVIDGLLLLHELAFQPKFRKMREVALKRQPAIDLIDLFYERAHWTKEMAAEKSVRFGGDKAELQAIHALASRYPQLVLKPPLKYIMARKWRSLKRALRPTRCPPISAKHPTSS